MTGRDRLMSIINGEQADRISWVTMAKREYACQTGYSTL